MKIPNPRELRSLLHSRGCSVDLTAGNHWRVTFPSGRFTIIGDPERSSPQNVRNALSHLRRMGLNIEAPPPQAEPSQAEQSQAEPSRAEALDQAADQAYRRSLIERLFTTAERRGLSVLDIAGALDLHPNVVYLYRNGKVLPRKLHVLKAIRDFIEEPSRAEPKEQSRAEQSPGPLTSILTSLLPELSTETLRALRAAIDAEVLTRTPTP